jgi:hypothetical protein
MKTLNVTSIALVLLATGACSGPTPQRALPFYRCEYGIEFTAQFVDNSVTLNGSRGYDVLYRGGKPGTLPGSSPPKPNEYSNARMEAQFLLGPTQSEAIVRYPLLPLVARCAREN